MAAINPLARELVLKIVFYGPGLGGKTTTLQHVHDAAKPEHRGKMVSLATAVDRTLYFDFLPVRLPKTRGMSVRLQLFTVPGQVYYNSTRKLVLTGADGLVFVADSQAARQDANLESFENLVDNLRDQKRELADIPHVLQYNKRDLENLLSIEDLERMMNRHKAPSVATVARTGEGIFETLSLITERVLEAFQGSLPEEVGSAALELTSAEGGLAAAFAASQAPLGDLMTPSEGPLSTRNVSVVTENLLDRGAPPRVTGFPEPGEHEERKAPESAWPRAQTRPAPPSSQRSELPALSDEDEVPSEGSKAPRAAAKPFSFSSLWGDGERDLVRETEAAIAAQDNGRVVDLLDALAARILASAGALLGQGDAPRDSAVVPLLLGLDGPRYLAFRALVRDARAGIEPDERAVLAAYAFVIELRLARARIGL
jgi:mutual gliding-motility protein MglA